MIYSTDYLELTRRINPISFVRYLKDTGWKQYPFRREDVRVFQLFRGDGFTQVKIPMDKGLSDYRQAMFNAVSTVASVSGKRVEQLMLYLLNPNADILKIRLDRKDTEVGSIHFDDAIRLYDNVKKLLAAAARDILHPKKYHQGRVDATVSQFLSACRYGQTEVGSYVVSVVCPFTELDDKKELKQLTIFSEEEECERSLTRQVTSRVMSALATMKKHIDNGETERLYGPEADGTTVSANFYEAVLGLNPTADDASIEFLADWAPTVRRRPDVPGKITLTRDYCQPIQTAVSKLKEEISQAKKIVGKIRKLESTPDADRRTTGLVTIVYLGDDDKPKAVKVQLDRHEYEKAIFAHEKGAYVEAVGDFSGRGKNKKMICRSFGILSDSE